MRKAKLKDLFDYLPKSKVKAGDGLEEGMYPFYTSSENQTKYLNEYQHGPGCLVFGTGGKASVHFATCHFSTSTDCIAIRCKQGVEIDARYVFQYFKGNMQVLENGFKGAGLKHISKAYLSDIQIPYPEDIDDQRRIAHLLSQVEGLIAQRKQHLQQLDDLLKGVFLEMFGFTDGTFTRWKIEVLAWHSQVVSGVTKGKKYAAEELIEVPYMRVANVQDGHLYLGDVKTIAVTRKEVDQYKLHRGDLLLTEGGDPDKLGRGFVWEEQIPNCIHQNHIFRVRINDRKEINPYYLSALVGSRYGKTFFLKSAKQTTGIASINSTQLKNFPVAIPPIGLQNQFAAIVEKVEGIKSRYQKNFIDLEALYGALSQQAFKGELDLSRVALPAAPVEGESPVAAAVPAPITTPVIELPETDLLLPALQDRTQLAPLLRFWLEAYRTQLGRAAFSLERFSAAAQARLGELHPDNDFELDANDYEQIKTWVFEALSTGRLVQAINVSHYDEKTGEAVSGNLIELKASQT